MENREILVANTKTQQRIKLTTNAETLKELKDAMDAQGIDYSGMTFTEGISKTQLLDDATQLPKNIMYKGQPTNNLVILLTNTKKNIASGADRAELYTAIKENGLCDEIKEAFGRNFTQVPTAKLQEFLEGFNAHQPADENEEDEDYGNDDVEASEEENDTSFSVDTIVDSLVLHIIMLKQRGSLTIDDLQELRDRVTALINKSKEKTASAPVSTSDGINDDDIDGMIDELGM